MAGITFGAAKDSLRLVVDNGVGVTDARVMRRTNEATQELLAELIPVGGMLTIDTVVDATGFILLPKEMENAIVTEITGNSTTVNGSSDIQRGWYNIVNQFAYVDPSQAHDNPLIDFFLVPDPDNPTTVLRRKYFYPGGTSNATVRITGAKRYLPITSDNDFLIIQNVPALKRMITALERYENNQTDDGDKLKARSVEMLAAEVKKHQMDPMRAMKRKSEYESDLTTYNIGTMGWVRARLALEVPGAQMMGKEEITRVLERAELRLMEMGIWKGCIEEFTAQVVCGHIVMPNRVESILAADLCGQPIKVRSIFFKYLENGPGNWDCSCGGRLEDEGDIIMNDGFRRHKYQLKIGSTAATSSTTSSSSDSGGSSTTPCECDILTADSYLYVGTFARFVALAGGMRLEVKDAGGNWVEQSTWTE